MELHGGTATMYSGLGLVPFEAFAATMSRMVVECPFWLLVELFQECMAGSFVSPRRRA
jgi:hypothetical protein